MRLKIISDGTPGGTKVVNAETGEPVVGVCSITFGVKGGDLAHALLLLEETALEFEGEIKVLSEPFPLMEEGEDLGRK